MKLSKDEQYLLGLVIKTSNSIHTEESFKQTLYPIVYELFPHKMFVCEIGLPNDHSAHHILNSSFPNEYLPTNLTEEGIINSPLSRLWLEIQKPQYLDGTRLAALAGPDEPWLTAFKQKIFKNMVGHGIYNHDTKHVSFFYFADITRAWDEKSIFLLKLFIPHLHAALVYANLSVRQADSKKDKLPVKRKPQNLRLVFTG